MTSLFASLARLFVVLVCVACIQIVASPALAASKATAIAVTGPFPDATVTIDGQARGVIGTGLTVDVPAGTHKVRVDQRGYRPFEVTVNVESGTTETVNVAALQRGVSPWTWVAVGTLVLAGVVTVAVLSTPSTIDDDDTDTTTTTTTYY